MSIASAAREFKGLVMVLTEDVQSAVTLEQGLSFFLEHEQIPVFGFPDWETLPYDIFAPLPELISQRLQTLYQLESVERGLLVVPVSTLLQRLPPRDYIETTPSC